MMDKILFWFWNFFEYGVINLIEEYCVKREGKDKNSKWGYRFSYMVFGKVKFRENLKIRNWVYG